MRFREFFENTSGAIASVSSPGKSVKGGNLLTGQIVSRSRINPLEEGGKMNELSYDIKTMDNGNFKKKYGHSKEYFEHELSSKPIIQNDSLPFQVSDVLKRTGVKIDQVTKNNENWVVNGFYSSVPLELHFSRVDSFPNYDYMLVACDDNCPDSLWDKIQKLLKKNPVKEVKTVFAKTLLTEANHPALTGQWSRRENFPGEKLASSMLSVYRSGSGRRYLTENKKYEAIGDWVKEANGLGLSSIKIGDSITTLLIGIPYWDEEIIFLGSTKTKTITDIKQNSAGEIETIYFGKDMFPNQPNLSTVSGDELSIPLCFANKEDLEIALSSLVLSIPEGWDYSLVGLDDPRFGIRKSLDEADSIIAPGKGKKYKIGFHSKDDEERLSQFKKPFTAVGLRIKDARGNIVCSGDNDDIAKEIAKALNEYSTLNEEAEMPEFKKGQTVYLKTRAMCELPAVNQLASLRRHREN